MANQTVTSSVNYDSASIGGLLDGETITINGGTVTIDADMRWNQQAAVVGNVTLSSSLGGSLVIDGTQVWEVPFSASTGNVPTQNALGSNGVTGGTSGATGELTRVWAANSLTPATAGGAMPATGFIKLRSRVGNFQSGETITLPGGATVTASSAGRRSWIHLAGREGSSIQVPRLGRMQVTGDWYELGTTNGTDGQTFQYPVADECPALQVETAAGSGLYEWWLNAARRWIGLVQLQGVNTNNATTTANVADRPATDSNGYISTVTRMRETTANGIHTYNTLGFTGETGVYTARAYIAKDGRRWGYFGVISGSDRYGVLIDFDASGAVVATPTSGSPTNTSNTVTPVGGGWYLVEVTINNPLATNSIAANIGSSNSATPTYASGIPSFVGDTAQGLLFADLQVFVPPSIQLVESGDERGKYFFSNPQSGVITFAQRTGRTAGQRPASGCRVRIPNVLTSSAPSVGNATNTQVAYGSRFGLSNFSGSVEISNAVWTWAMTTSGSYSVTVQNVAAGALSFTGVASTVSIANCGIGLSATHNASLSVSSSTSGGTITDVRAAGGVAITGCSGYTLARVRAEIPGDRASPSRPSNPGAIATTNSSNVALVDCAAIGGWFRAEASSNVSMTGSLYADRVVGTTNTVSASATFSIASGCSNIRIDGLAAVGGLANVATYGNVVDMGTNCRDIDIRNFGTPSSPYDCGTVNPSARVVNVGATCYNVALRRLYTVNTRANTITSANTSQGVRAINLWGDAADATSHNAFDMTCQGCRWSNASTVQGSVYGVHWEDAFTGTTSGRLTISGNEPLASTADQCSTSLGANAGFTGGGQIAMPNLGDTVTWTMPYYALGHTGIAGFTYGASTTETWVLTGTNPQNFEFEYQIDTGNGAFSGWKFLLDIARQSSGGTSGTNTITLNAADVTAMTRKPAVGDLVATANARIPAGTTITGVSGASGNVLTLSANFTSTVGASELVYVWKDIAAETISATTGYKLKVRARVNTAASGNLFSFLRIPFDTTSSAQQTQYPLPGSLVTVSGLVQQSRVKISRIDTGAILAQASSGGGTTVNFDVPYTGSVAIEARNASTSPSYRPWLTQTTISSSSPTTIIALQETD